VTLSASVLGALIGAGATIAAAALGWIATKIMQQRSDLTKTREERRDGQIRELREDIAANSDELSSLRPRVTHLEKRTAGTKEQLDRIETSIDALDTDIERLAEKKVDRSEFEHVVKQLNANLEGLHETQGLILEAVQSTAANGSPRPDAENS